MEVTIDIYLDYIKYKGALIFGSMYNYIIFLYTYPRTTKLKFPTHPV